jgi:folate-binding protein YgfZ
MLGIYRPQSPIQWSLAILSGPDAKDFLHRLTTVNVKNLQPGSGAPGCFLTAQGKFRSYFTLWQFAVEEFAFEFDAGSDGKWKEALLAAVDQYTFAEKQTLTDVTAQMECRWLFFKKEGPLCSTFGEIQPGETKAVHAGARLTHHGDIDFGRRWITAWGKPGTLDAWAKECFSDQIPELGFEQIERWRVDALRPRVGAEITDALMPLEVGLRESIAENKGCYPGQEVIEKIISLGSPPRRLAQIEGQGPAPQPGTKVFNTAEPAAEVGEITSVTTEGGKFHALAIVKKIHAKEGLPVRIGKDGQGGSIVRVANYA